MLTAESVLRVGATNDEAKESGISVLRPGLPAFDHELELTGVTYRITLQG